jgi:hypothetical protein
VYRAVVSVSIERSDRTLLRGIARRLRAGEARAGRRFNCQPGCTECCVGPFPITSLDVLRLRRGLRTLRRCHPARARGLEQRAAGYLERIRGIFPGDVERGLMTTEAGTEERFLCECSDVPCPALDPDRRCCELYPYRPVSCRTFGPPVRIGEQSLPPCAKCVAGLTIEQVERGRVDVDPLDREGELLRALAPDQLGEGETLVVFALVGNDQLEVRTDEGPG